ncbi:MAG: universal stress protein, partial [Candidatus Methylarchaceae archaeon HK01M]|nr:universal stress protein [Candidatus Methylarchaceae archaeon HK01M]
MVVSDKEEITFNNWRFLDFLGKEMIKKILVALDGSEHANHALDFALDLSEKYSATIVLLSVFHPYYILGVPSDTETELARAQKAGYEKMLSEALKKVNRLKPNLNVSTKLKEGRPADKIVETAKEGEFDLIVIGSRGLGGVSQLLLGSV